MHTNRKRARQTVGYVQLAWPGLLWWGLVALYALLSQGMSRPGTIMNPYVVVFLVPIVGGAILSLSFVWVSLTAKTDSRSRFLATTTNLGPLLVWLGLPLLT